MTTRKLQIEKDDRRDLVAYVSGVAFARLAASPLGPMLDRAELRAVSSRPCPVCGGVGQLDGTERMREKAESVAERRRRERAWIVASYKDHRVSARRIPHLTCYRALRERAASAEDRWMAYQAAERYRREHAASIAAELKVESKALGDQEVDAIRREVASLREDEPAEPAGCPACGGYRLVPCAHHQGRELPVQSGEVEDRAVMLDDGCYWLRAPLPRSIQTVVHETRVSVGVDLGEQEIERLGRVGGRLARIGERPDGLLLVAALRAMHTPGAAAGPASVLALTPAGRKLVADHARGWSDDPTPDQVLDRVRARQREAPDVRTGSRLAAARAIR